MQGNPMTILDSGLHALDPGFEVLDSGPQTLAGFWITWIRILFSKVQYSEFHKKKFPHSEIWVTFFGANFFF